MHLFDLAVLVHVEGKSSQLGGEEMSHLIFAEKDIERYLVWCLELRKECPFWSAKSGVLAQSGVLGLRARSCLVCWACEQGLVWLVGLQGNMLYDLLDPRPKSCQSFSGQGPVWSSGTVPRVLPGLVVLDSSPQGGHLVIGLLGPV